MPKAVTDSWTAYESEYPDAAHESVERIPLRRMGTGQEIGQVIALLCTEAASYMTGSVVKIDGGSAP
jgi:NAD(P)-dependent dehydrogenase (short-subunit alcohol dehydrogenase family)